MKITGLLISSFLNISIILSMMPLHAYKENNELPLHARPQQHSLKRDVMRCAVTAGLAITALYCFTQAYFSYQGYGLCKKADHTTAKSPWEFWRIGKNPDAGSLPITLDKSHSSDEYTVGEWLDFFKSTGSVIGWTTAGLLITKIAFWTIMKEWDDATNR
ncbi:MAG: hypothetical protein WA432_02370 [Candidatus Babeliaceae bacterium]